MQLPSEDEYGEFLDWKRGRIEEEDWDKDPGEALRRALDKIPDHDKEAVRAVVERYNRTVNSPDEEEIPELSPEEQEAADERFHAELEAAPDIEAAREVLRKHGRLGGEDQSGEEV